mmetsp:Transcript_38653/g.65056  ORF Transcript_38653/g.65056 Transcript_38653/m.65056 type:complete len:311 (-) Transcript_38653:249-1181(-)|eukprot:CAMPEP_0198230014 /NCGR_PEP_ID=MMETSP1445-20131203/114392_1 /TAXON_ID=36898 /ORGANISM="Pyramimonas sp., Strain CCMP2087" /LENGTH=310 /DNA_ID=CAMNT_0043910509 /DNA_START=848 /DNA_END=1780 /DNA_ORIENTATION=-
MSLEEFKAERARIESNALFAEYKALPWDAAVGERFTRIVVAHERLTVQIADFERLHLAHAVAKVNASAGQRGEVISVVETELQKQTRLFHDEGECFLPSFGASFKKRKENGSEELHKSLFEQNERLMEAGVHIIQLQQGLMSLDSPEVQLLKDQGHELAVKNLEKLHEQAEDGKQWLILQSNFMLVAFRSGWKAVDEVVGDRELTLNHAQSKILKKFEKAQEKEAEHKRNNSGNNNGFKKRFGGGRGGGYRPRGPSYPSNIPSSFDHSQGPNFPNFRGPDYQRQQAPPPQWQGGGGNRYGGGGGRGRGGY